MRRATLSLLAMIGAQASAQDIDDIRNRPIFEGPEPRTCVERGAFGFCFYDNGWRPAVDNPAFRPLRASDPDPDAAPICTITNRRGATIGHYGEGDVDGPLLRINGRAVRFRRVDTGNMDHELYRGPEGRLTVDNGATVARAAEYEAHRARMTFIDRRGRVLTASVRIDCAA